MRKNSRPQDYRKYHMGKRECAGALLLSAGATGMLAFFFYRSLWAVLPLSGVGLLCFRCLLRKKRKKIREELVVQFREGILAVATLLQAGYSAENAFVECYQDMVLLYGEHGLLCRELRLVRRGLCLNVPLERLLEDFAARSGCEEVGQFAQVFALAKRSGGNMSQVIRNAAELIGKRVELRQEMRTLLGGRRMELNIMRGMPFGILLYVGLGNPGYFAPLYHNPQGIAVMSGCLLAYLTAYFLGEEVMDRMEAEMAV